MDRSRFRTSRANQTPGVSPVRRTHRIAKRKGFRLNKKLVLSGAFAVMAMGVIGTCSLKVMDYFETKRYAISPQVRQLVGKSETELSSQIKFDAKNKLFQYNQAAAQGIVEGQVGDTIRIGAGSKYYGVILALEAKNGQAVYDASNKVSFSMKPQFDLSDGKQVEDAIVYPFGKGQVIYTLKEDGIKEDVVISKKVSETSFAYRLELPDSLMAQLNKDGSVGIYSVSKEYQAANIAAKLGQDGGLKKPDKKPEELRFTIPKPTIVDSSKRVNSGQAWFELKDTTLIVHAKNLQDLQYPISIDPSVVVSSASSFMKGQPEGDQNFNPTGGSLVRMPLSDGTLGSWQSGGVLTYPLNNDRTGHNLASYGDMLIAFGGRNKGAGGVGAPVTIAEYAVQNTTDGTTSVWTAMPSTSPQANVEGEMGLAYNGYVYVVGGGGGVNGNTRVEYAAICNGTNTTSGFSTDCQSGQRGTSSWCSSSTAGCGSKTAPQALLSGRHSGGLIAYNGYMYLNGGCTGSGSGNSCNNGVVNQSWTTDTTYYAKINLDGSIGTWSAGTTLFDEHGFTDSVAANGYIYTVGGCSDWSITNVCTANATIEYAKILPSGALGDWNVATGTLDLAKPSAVSAIVIKGYLYVIGGGSGNSGTVSNVVDYAPIYANGNVGGVSNTTYSMTSRYNSRIVPLNGYIYLVAGCTAAPPNCGSHNNYAADTNFVSINTLSSYAGGDSGNWASTTQFTAGGHYYSGGASFNDAIYNLGGCTTTNCSSIDSSSYFATICQKQTTTAFTSNCTAGSTAGTTTNWKALANSPAARFGQGVVTHNGYIYSVGGCSAASALNTCTTYVNTVQYARICDGTNTDGGCSTSSIVGDIGTWTTSASYATNGRWGAGVAVWNNNIYIIGGTTSGGVQGDVIYAKLGSNGSISIPGGSASWPSTGSAFTAKTSITATAYNGYLYFFGGEATAQSYSSLTSTGSYALINADGTLDNTWNTTTSYGTAATGVKVVAANGLMYLTGGATAAGAANFLTSIRYAQIQSSGALSSWTTDASGTLPTEKRKHHTTIIARGYLYQLNGFEGDTDVSDNNDFAQLVMSPRVASYSRMIDTASTVNVSTGSMPTITRLSLGSSSAGMGRVCASLAGSSMSLSGINPSCGALATLNSKTPITTGKSRYMFVFATLDDSLTATALDDNPSSISSLNILFHAGNDRRLRGGKSFTDMNSGTTNQTQLDTEP